MDTLRVRPVITPPNPFHHFWILYLYPVAYYRLPHTPLKGTGTLVQYTHWMTDGSAYLIDLVWTSGGLGQYLTPLNPFHHLGILGASIGHLTTGEHLPAEHAVGPDVALAREAGKVQHLQTANDSKLQKPKKSKKAYFSPFLIKFPFQKKEKSYKNRYG
jgi:hypothetical protein